MKIISWNVNGLLARSEAVNNLAADLKPDIMCFQKIKTKNDSLINIPEYMRWFGFIEDGLAGGVCTYLRHGLNFDMESQRGDIPEWLLKIGCINVLELKNFILVNAYFPYAKTDNDEFIRIRKRWNSEFHGYIVNLANEKPVVICGDLNIVAKDIDAWDGISVKNLGCYFPWEHRDFDLLLNQADLVDSYREMHPSGRDYSYFFQNRPEYRLSNQGFRIDYFLVSRELMPYVVKSEILSDIIETTNSPILFQIEWQNNK